MSQKLYIQDNNKTFFLLAVLAQLSKEIPLCLYSDIHTCHTLSLGIFDLRFSCKSSFSINKPL